GKAENPISVRDQLAANGAADRARGAGDEHRGGEAFDRVVGGSYRTAPRPSDFHASGSAAAARPILTTSPGINGQKPTAHTFEPPTNRASHGSPTAKITTFPRIMERMVLPTRRSHPCSARKPQSHAPGTKPRRYPAVGPRSTDGPALPPAKTGRPAAPSARYVITAAAPRQRPRAAPTRRTAKVWPVTGTGENGSGIAT